MSFATDVAAPSTTHRMTVLRLGPDAAQLCDDAVVEEVPVAIAYNGIVHAVMLATPDDLEEFGLGFSLTEGIIADAEELESLRVVESCDGIEVRMEIPMERFLALKGKRRSIAGRSGCGVCGVESLQAIARSGRPVPSGGRLSVGAVERALPRFAERQTLHRATGAAHGVAWVDAAGNILAVREDVGRHNALDKLIGWLVRTGVDRRGGFVLTSSRASYELVQKAARLGISGLVAISAPTGLAVRMAESCGVSLAGFARGDRLVVYSHGDRWV